MTRIPPVAHGAERHVEAENSERRWVSGSGAAVPTHPAARDLLEHGRGHRRRWASAGNVTDASLDQLETERLLWRLVDAGLVKIHQRRNRRGDWDAYEWTLTEQGEKRIDDSEDTDEVDTHSYLSTGQRLDDRHPALRRIRRWLEAEQAPQKPRVARILMALGRQLRRGRRPTARAVSIDAEGDSKRVDIEYHRETLEQILDCPLEDLFRLRGRAVRAWGAFEFEIRGRRITGDWSVPWLALTADTLDNLEAIHTKADRIVTIENLAAFEPFVREERPAETIAVFTSGFPGSLVVDFLERLVDAGVSHIDHWGDLDVGGLRILEHLRQTFPCPVRPFRMDPELLEELPTRPLTDSDRAELQKWLGDCAAPVRTQVKALLAADRKLEQEAWYVTAELRHS